MDEQVKTHGDRWFQFDMPDGSSLTVMVNTSIANHGQHSFGIEHCVLHLADELANNIANVGKAQPTWRPHLCRKTGEFGDTEVLEAIRACAKPVN